MNYKKVWRQYGKELVFGGLILGTLAFSTKDIKSNMRSLTQARETIAANSQSSLMLQQQLELEQSQAQIAETRFKSGCTIVVAVKSAKNLATLVEGQSVLDRTTKNPLPSGTVVCDANGATGVLQPNSQGLPVVSNMAMTGNRALAIAQIKKIHGAKVYYYTPEKN